MNLKQSGDIYITESFISCTRDLFYGINFDFGDNILALEFPENTKGCLLFIEAYSLFPKEEEVIVSPFCHFELTEKITRIILNPLSGKKKKFTIYKLLFIKRENKYFLKDNLQYPIIPTLDLNTKIDNVPLKTFIENICDINKQFNIVIDDIKIS
jgi:hypothetical protein